MASSSSGGDLLELLNRQVCSQLPYVDGWDLKHVRNSLPGRLRWSHAFGQGGDVCLTLGMPDARPAGQATGGAPAHI